MKLYAIRVFVTDWPKACEFYGETLGLTQKFSDESMGWAEYDIGGASLGVERVASDDAERAARVGRFVGMSLQVDDIDATYRTLQDKGVEFASPPQKQPWGGTLAQMSDPDGNVITLLG